MFNKILIANRGEIAVRIIRACRELGIKTVAIYSTADKDALHVKLADEAVCVGGPRGSDSYLNMNNILSATIETKAQAIHPGFGFLSENPIFAKMCEDCNIKFIGPKAEVISLMGNKANARKTMIKAKIPVIPGSEGVLKTYKDAQRFCKKYGYPVMIKAASGGGGKGIRVVEHESELRAAYESASAEALVSFGDDSLYIEKVIKNARHIEVQLMADEHGNVCHLYERDCSLQRKNQKLLEEAPAMVLDDMTRKKICATAVRAAKSVGYSNAGTIEFLYDRDKNFYFMEMNTRIQVEHPITEMITGIDIVKEQIRVAYGHKLSFSQRDVSINGHAIECRINAENTKMNFTPSPGTVEFLHFQAGGLGVRVDSGIYSGYTIPPYYDAMIAKIITHGKTRDEAITKMKSALAELKIEGIHSNVEYQKALIENDNFKRCKYYVKFIEEKFNVTNK